MAGEPAEPVRIRIDLSYDGTGFSGWAAQPGRRTVEGVLAETLGHVLRLPAAPRLTVAGRTDTGVHARGQVAHADLQEAVWAAHADAARRRLARALPVKLSMHRRLWTLVSGSGKSFLNQAMFGSSLSFTSTKPSTRAAA